MVDIKLRMGPVTEVIVMIRVCLCSVETFRPVADSS